MMGKVKRNESGICMLGTVDFLQKQKKQKIKPKNKKTNKNPNNNNKTTLHYFKQGNKISNSVLEEPLE